jgi:NDP-sugar pyrophosphorylase family protein
VILAGGKGTRLLPYTVSLPKPLVPIGDLPIVEIVIRQLAAAGFDSITLAVNHQADLIRAYFGDGAKWRVHIDYSLETMPLGTMGPLRIIDDLPDNFLVMNGDVLTDLDFAGLLERHSRERAFTIGAPAAGGHDFSAASTARIAWPVCREPRVPYP